MPQLYSTTFTAQQVIDGVATNVRQVLASNVTPDSTTLVFFLNRVHAELLRASRWMFLMSGPKYFITTKGQTDYWLGATGTQPAGVTDTNLNLTDLRVLKNDSVIDRSNFHVLKSVSTQPTLSKLFYPDLSARSGRPAVWADTPDNPNILRIFPAPDNQNTFQPVPEAPALTQIAGGALANRTYFITTTFVDSFGNESSPSIENSFDSSAGSLVKVTSPRPITNFSSSLGVTYNQYKVYASVTSGSEQRQTVSPITIGTDWTEPSTGLISGPSAPGTNSLISIQGYIIEFKYWKQRLVNLSLSSTIQVPDDYVDVLQAGVTARAFLYLNRFQESQQWYAMYRDGMTQMIKDTNQFLRQMDYIQPDGASIGQRLPGVEAVDLGFLIP